LTCPARYSAVEIVEQTGIPLDLLVTLRRASGLPVANPDENAYTDGDLAAARTVRAFLDAGLPPEAILRTTLVFGEAAARAAAAVRTNIGEALLRPGDSERDVALRYAQSAHDLHGPAGDLLKFLFRVHTLDQLRNASLADADLDSGDLHDVHEVAVCFADIVGFTRLGERLDADELGELTDTLTMLGVEVAEPPVRFVKTIGDAIMLVSTDPAGLVDAALRLLTVAEHKQLPPLRVGAAFGAALHRSGDWYGPPVNLASRLTGLARPGSLVTSEELHDRLADRFRWTFIGRKRIKGLDKPVSAYRCRLLAGAPPAPVGVV
jgi:adenylate cyclase